MAAGGIHEQETIPVKFESPKAAKSETGPFNIAELIILTTAAVGGWYILSFVYEEAVKFIKELGQ
jgi:hypothetical protein